LSKEEKSELPLISWFAKPGGFVWEDGATSPSGYCYFVYDPMSYSEWRVMPTDSLHHIKRNPARDGSIKKIP